MRAIGAISILVVFLSACTGIGYIATSDPYKKLGQAQSLVEEDRLLLAEDVIGQALAQFQESGDLLGMADAYHAYGNLYKNDLYHNGRWTQAFKQRGTYDGTYTKSIVNFQKAQALFEQLGDEVGVAKCLMGIGNVYSIRNEVSQACAYYGEALERFRKAKASGKPLATPQMLTGYADVGALTEAFMEKQGCGT
jgi:tetratricopeptide (TPR) repeat protein